VHVPVPLQPPPDQPAKLEPADDFAVNLTTVPLPYFHEQLLGQVTPDPAALPLPVPASETVRVYDTGGLITELLMVSTSDPHVLIDAMLAEFPEYDACQ
jgi:hypothetical protein